MKLTWVIVCAVLALSILCSATNAENSAVAADAETEAAPESKTSEAADVDADVKVEEVSEDNDATDDASEQLQPWKYDKNGILILTRHNFDAAIDAHEHLFVVFHTPACAQCIQLHPLFVQAWKKLEGQNTPDLSVQFAKIDATNETALLVHYGITQFPTLTFFKNQKEKMYDGGYRAMDIEAWVTKRMGDPARPVFTVEEIEKLREDNDVIAVGFFNELDSVSAIIYNRIADAVHDYPFFFVADPELFEKYNIIDDTVVVFKNFDDGRSEFAASKDFETDALMEFLRLETFPLVSELNIENVWRVTEEANHIKSHFLFFRNASDPAVRANARELLMPAAKKYKGEFLFLMIDMADRRMYHMEEFFGVHKDQTPALRIFRYEGPTFKFRPLQDDGPVTEADILKFCEDFKVGNLKPFVLEEALPEDWDAAPVKYLTAVNYDEVTGDKSRHVFVILYAPWCPQCKLVMPIFEKLADMYQEHSDAITFAKMDATANEVEGVDLMAYPTFFLYGREDAERQQYNGTRTIDTMVAFLSQYTDVQLYPEDDDTSAAAEGGDPTAPTEGDTKHQPDGASVDTEAVEEGEGQPDSSSVEAEEHRKDAAAAEESTSTEAEPAALKDEL